jgi:hypothetical protein
MSCTIYGSYSYAIFVLLNLFRGLTKWERPASSTDSFTMILLNLKSQPSKAYRLHTLVLMADFFKSASMTQLEKCIKALSKVFGETIKMDLYLLFL